MERRRAIVTLAGGLAVAIALAACAVRQTHGVGRAPPPPAGPDNKYYYPGAHR